MKLIEKLKEKVRLLKREIPVLYFAYQNPEIGFLPKFFIFLTLGYLLSPVDLIPDFIPVIGYLDDIIIVPLLVTLSISFIPKTVMEEARIRASNEKINLKKNWLFGVIFISIWVLIIVLIIIRIIKVFIK